MSFNEYNKQAHKDNNSMDISQNFGRGSPFVCFDYNISWDFTILKIRAKDYQFVHKTLRNFPLVPVKLDSIVEFCFNNKIY